MDVSSYLHNIWPNFVFTEYLITADWIQKWLKTLSALIINILIVIFFFLTRNVGFKYFEEAAKKKRESFSWSQLWADTCLLNMVASSFPRTSSRFCISGCHRINNSSPFCELEPLSVHLPGCVPPGRGLVKPGSIIRLPQAEASNNCVERASSTAAQRLLGGTRQSVRVSGVSSF